MRFDLPEPLRPTTRHERKGQRGIAGRAEDIGARVEVVEGLLREIRLEAREQDLLHAHCEGWIRGPRARTGSGLGAEGGERE